MAVDSLASAGGAHELQNKIPGTAHILQSTMTHPLHYTSLDSAPRSNDLLTFSQLSRFTINVIYPHSLPSNTFRTALELSESSVKYHEKHADSFHALMHSNFVCSPRRNIHGDTAENFSIRLHIELNLCERSHPVNDSWLFGSNLMARRNKC